MIVLVNMSSTSYFPSFSAMGSLTQEVLRYVGNIQLTFRTVCVRTRVDAMASYDWMAFILQLLIRAGTANSLNFMVGHFLFTQIIKSQNIEEIM